MIRLKQKGFALPVLALVAVGVAILMVTISRIFQMNTHSMVYFNSMTQTNRLAQMGLNDALAKLALDPNHVFDGSWVSINSEERYQNQVNTSTNPNAGGFYIVTSASRTVSGRVSQSRLHSYVKLSNLGDYFAAVSSELKITRGIQASTGKIYAPNLKFFTTPTTLPPTRLKSAVWVYSCDPPLAPNWSAGTKAMLQIADAPNQPVKLDTPLLFPQVLDADIERFRTLAGPHTATDTFKGVLFPPGYAEYSGTPESGDNYTAHTTDNLQHIYFFDGDIHIEGTVHGQILFVATGDIYISSSIINYSGTAPTDFPGHTVALGASEAHQAVLITRKNIIVDNTYYTGPTNGDPPPGVSTQTIQAMIFCPNGELSATPYDNGNLYPIHANLALDFTGSLILGSWRDIGDNRFPNVFRARRAYQYMDTLRTNPPPYLPAVTEINFSIEESLGTNSLF